MKPTTKLLNLLFENVNSSDFIQELKQAMRSSSPDLFSVINHPEKFYETNKQKIDKILNGATEFKFLGAGSFGVAFSLGDKVLKLEQNPHRPETILNQLNKQTKKGLHFTAIYDHGTLISDIPKKILNQDDLEETIYYTIMEKMETEKINKNYENFLYLIFRQIQKSSGMYPPITNKKLEQHFKTDNRYNQKIKEMEQDLRLSPNWLSKLIKDIKSLDKLNLTDFHAGNIGIRRVGGEGYFVFFD